MKFQKVVNHWKGLELTYDWLLVMESAEDIMNFHEKIDGIKIRKAWDNLDEFSKGRAHIDTTLGTLIHYSAKPGDSILTATIKVMDRIIMGKIETLHRYGKIYQNKVGGYFPHSDDIEVLEEMIVDSDSNIIFPSYTKDDIHIKQWADGTHWYAYVGDFWVHDYYGKKKFDRQKDAQEAAQWYLYKLNKKDFVFKGDEEDVRK